MAAIHATLFNQPVPKAEADWTKSLAERLPNENGAAIAAPFRVADRTAQKRTRAPTLK